MSTAPGQRLTGGARVVGPLLVAYLIVCAVAQPGSSPVRDEPDLLAAASRLVHGHLVAAGVTTTPRAYLWHGPGLVVLLAPLVALKLPLVAIRFVDPLLLAMAAWLFYRLLSLRLSPRPSAVFTWAFGLYLPFTSVVPEVHKEPLAIVLVVTAMLTLTVGMRSGRLGPFLATGAALGALAMVRLEYGWLAIALLGLAGARWLTHRHDASVARLAVAAAVAVGLCVPWLSYTDRLTGRPLYWGTSSGLSLYWMSPTRPGETGQWHGPDEVARDPALTAFRPLFARVGHLDPVASDATLRAHAMANVRARPVTYVRNVVANVGRLFFAVPMRPELSAMRLASDLACNGGLLLGVGWSLAALWRRRRSGPPETGPIVWFVVVAVALHLPASASPRMLLPIVPALLWIVAQGTCGAPGRRRAGATAAAILRWRA